MAEYALAALDQTVKEFNGDSDRSILPDSRLAVMVRGRSLRQIPGSSRRLFLSLVVLWANIRSTLATATLIIPSVGDILESSEPYKEIAKAIGQTPVWVFHGARDDSVSIEFPRRDHRGFEGRRAGGRQVHRVSRRRASNFWKRTEGARTF